MLLIMVDIRALAKSLLLTKDRLCSQHIFPKLVWKIGLTVTNLMNNGALKYFKRTVSRKNLKPFGMHNYISLNEWDEWEDQEGKQCGFSS